MKKMTLMDQLKKETRKSHNQLEKLPYFQALAEGNLGRDSYIAHLRALSVIHGVMEDQIMRANDPILGIVWNNGLCKMPLLIQDLHNLDHENVQDLPAVVDASVELTRKIRLRLQQDPMSMLGYLYVFEGSTLGGAVLKQQLSKAFGLSDNMGMSYVAQYGDDKRKHWDQFKKKMNSVQLQEDEKQRIVQAAHELFEGLMPVFEGLHPIGQQTPFYNATSLNPESGNQPISEDAEEINAALRAGKITWKKFPYYAWRYSDRGEQYTRSDSAWITTLVNYNWARVQQQIRWLGRVLSTRGMPQWMLEIHLQNMYNELIKVHPDKEKKYALLLEASADLGEMRKACFDDQALQKFSDQFDAEVGSEWSWRLKHMGALLGAAVADEKSGIDGAVSSIESWATDSRRFPDIFIAAVQKIIRDARKKAK
ncbi:MAG: biliverdin-producing heme oxygenase [SAR324 cluster bacterium]|nr:biliverdin-producing heme oxygenase [SAR324 cluster bacterium]